MKSIDKAVEISAETMKNVLKRNSIALRRRSSGSAGHLCRRSERGSGCAPQHHDQVPGFYRLKVGELK